jgi:hypothetical protein
MIDWLKQSQDMLKNWMDSQQKLWDAWMDTTKDAPASTSVWEQSIQTWENSIKNWMDMQALWMRTWARNAIANSESRDAQRFAQSVEKMTKSWVTVQEQIWDNWFAMIKELDPVHLNETMQSQVAEAAKIWQDNMNNMLDAQNEWTRKWAEIMQSNKDA